MTETPLVDWHGLLKAPITRGLLLSAALHLALLAVIQPAPGHGEKRNTVIQARLEISAAKPIPTKAPLLEPVTDRARSSEPHAQPTLVSSDTPAASTSSAPVEPGPAPVPVPAPAPAAMPGERKTGTESASPSTGPVAAPSLPSLPLGVDTTWYLARQVDVFPKSIGHIQPVYPEEARRQNLAGTLKLMLKIDDLGRVREAEVVEATPPGVFDAAALEAFRNARFQPAMRDGRPVRYQAYIRVDFKLED